MRILVKAEEKEYLVTCPVCGADLAYTNRDMLALPVNMQRSVGVPALVQLMNQNKCGVKCPECATVVEVPMMACKRQVMRREDGWCD